jgi:hypothetical protein
MFWISTWPVDVVVLRYVLNGPAESSHGWKASA